MKRKITYEQIGTIYSPFTEAKGTPIQPIVAKGIKGQVEIFPEYQEGLKDIEGFSHIVLLYHFHLSKKYSLEVVPFRDIKYRGLFATRAPSRPNPIGISVVRLIKVEVNRLFIENVDIINGTPLLDIKPFIGEFGNIGNIRKGWLEKNIGKLEKSRDDGRFIK